MDNDLMIRMECVARVMARAVIISARIEGMKATNAERQANGCALAYDERAFWEAEKELADLVSTQIGMT